MRVKTMRRVLVIGAAAAVAATVAVAGLSRGCGHGGSGAAATATTPATGLLVTTRAAWGVPDRPVRVVAFNVYWHQRGVDRVAASIALLRPDIVLLSEVPPADLPRLATKLGLVDERAQLHFASSRSASERGKPATGIISRFPLLDARPIPNLGGRELGVMGEVAVGEKRFCVAAIHLTPTLKPTPQEFGFTESHRANEMAALLREWESRGSRNAPPLIVGGDFNQLAQGPNYETMTYQLDDALIWIETRPATR
jgi:endonuclease/exonuclease/phosphatase family metal-dependent hydrolase